MARYNTSFASKSISGTSTISSPLSGAFTELTGAAPYTVTLPNPSLFPGETQTFYNATLGDITLVTPRGIFTGLGSSGTTSQLIIANSVISVTSDSANWVVLSEDGSALVATTGLFTGDVTINGASATTSITSNVVTINPTSISSINNVNIGANSRGSGAFTSLTANSSTTLTGNIVASNTTSGTLVVTGGVGVSGTIYASGFNGPLTGNATSVTNGVYQNSYGSFQSSYTNNIDANLNRNVGAYGSYASSATNSPTNSGILLNFTSQSDGSGDGAQLWMAYNSLELHGRHKWGGSWSAWRTYLSDNNYTTYTVTKTGTGASGTWGISVTGSAGSVAWNNVSSKPAVIANFLDNTWAGGSGYHGYQYSGGNWRFGFSSTGGVIDVYTDGNFYATDSSHLVLHAGNYTSYAMPAGSSATNSVDVRAPIFYDSNDTGFYCNPNGSSRVTVITLPQNPVGTTYGSGVSTIPPYRIEQTVGDNDGWRIYGEAGSTNTVRTIFEVIDDIETVGYEWLFRNKRTYSDLTATEPFRISGNGNIFSAGTLTQNSSDRRLKTNIEQIKDPLDIILNLNGVFFDWNNVGLPFGFNPDQTRDIGLIAQEIQKVLPEAVKPAPFDIDIDTGLSKSGENYLTVQYEKLIPVLIESIKAQQKQIDNILKEII